MEIKKNIENLSVEIIDIKLDTSTIPSIKEAKLVYINGKSKLVMTQEDMTPITDYLIK